MFGGVLLGGSARSAAPAAAEVRGWLARLADEATPADDAVLIEQIECLERLKSAAAARQARLTAAFAAAQRSAQRAAGGPVEKIGRGIGAQIALARHDSPHAGGRHLGLAEALVHEMPQTLAALGRGGTSEWRATLMARETACLSRKHRAAVDAALGPRLAGMGNGQVEREARRQGYQLDPSSAIRRIRGAQEDRTVTIRPAPDVMVRVTGFLPAEQGVAAYASLRSSADRLKAQGDSRSRGQIMADTFVQRLTGKATADPGDAEILLIVSDQTLSAPPTQGNPASAATTGSPSRSGATGTPTEPEPAGAPAEEAAGDPADEPARLHGYGPVPALVGPPPRPREHGTHLAAPRLRARRPVGCARLGPPAVPNGAASRPDRSRRGVPNAVV